MSDPLEFTSKSPRYALPLLFAGQAQKEFFVNEAHSLLDLLLHPAIEGETDLPPATPNDGECWLVGSNPSGEWAGHAGEVAARQAGAWIFAAPRDGMRLLDRSKMQDRYYRGGQWQSASSPTPVTGGTTVDVEARRAIDQLIAALVAGGILPTR